MFTIRRFSIIRTKGQSNLWIIKRKVDSQSKVNTGADEQVLPNKYQGSIPGDSSDFGEKRLQQSN